MPRVHGIDEHDREILDYLPGQVIDVDNADHQRRPARGRRPRLAHPPRRDGELPDAERRWYFSVAARQPGQVICHHDVAPYNIAFDGDALAGEFDWERPGPGDPVDDVAFLRWERAAAVPRDRGLVCGLRRPACPDPDRCLRRLRR